MATQDGLLSVLDAASAGLVAVTEALVKLTAQPLAAAALSADGTTLALAWRDRLLVAAAPWKGPKLNVLASYLCPEVREADGFCIVTLIGCYGNWRYTTQA